MKEPLDFPNAQAAYRWLEREVGDDCVDNYRLAYLDDTEALKTYEQLRQEGCRGEFDTTVTINGRKAKIGCNYGH